MFRSSLLAAALLALSFTAAHAEAPAKQPDLLSFSGGYFNFDKTEPRRQSADFRFEYRWGVSLLPKVSSYFNSWDKYVQFHPFLGIETNTRSAVYGLGGWAMDAYIGRNFIFTWSEGVGFFSPGDMAPLGSFVEFRSQAEFGYRFDNEMRLTAQISHISNAGITKRNPGAEIAGIYFHVPLGR